MTTNSSTISTLFVFPVSYLLVMRVNLHNFQQDIQIFGSIDRIELGQTCYSGGEDGTDGMGGVGVICILPSRFFANAPNFDRASAIEKPK